jgi:hypothetical protein
LAPTDLPAVNFLWQSKPFAQKLMDAWARGLQVNRVPKPNVIRPGQSLRSGPVVLYGIQPETFPHWLQCRQQGRDFYYIDNAYLSPGHDDDSYVRITKNALQCSGYGESDLARLAAHEVEIKDWREPTLEKHEVEIKDWREPTLEKEDGGWRKILITCQSGWWYIQNSTTLNDWVNRVIDEIRYHTERPIKIRLKPKADYQKSPNVQLCDDVTAPDDEVPFEEDLAEAFCVVTHSSNTAVEAILAGVPAFVLGQSAAQPFACNDLKLIEAPFVSYGDRWNWAGVLADNQWTLKEIREGKAWADLNG